MDIPTATVPPVVTAVTVPLPPDEAFALFTTGMGTWWPLATHSVAADTHEGRVRADSLTFEGRPGGRVFETMSDGAEADWGTVLEWQPPTRAAFSWKPNLSAGPFTRVEVTFSPAGEGTRVELVHSGWEQFGTAAEDHRRGYDGGWPRVLDRFAAAAR
jgi:uncharacterized protein YndB with AHSA1/START domain